MGFNKFEIPITDEQLPETKESKTHAWHFTKDGKAQLTCSIKEGHLYNAAPEMKEALVNAEFLLRKCSINPKEVIFMVASMKRAVIEINEILSKAEGM